MPELEEAKKPFLKNIAPTSLVGILLAGAYGLPNPWGEYVTVALASLYLVSLLATRVPAPQPGSKWLLPYRLLCLASANFGESKNDKSPTPATSKQVIVISDHEAANNLVQQVLSDRSEPMSDSTNANATPASSSNTTSTYTASATPASSSSTANNGASTVTSGSSASTPASSTASVDNGVPTVTVKKESISDLIEAGTSLYTSITGKESADTLKVVSGVSSIADVMLPIIDSKINIRLEDVIGGTTEVIGGVEAIIAAVKAKQS